MDKKLKKKFTDFPLSLYNTKWVEKAADKGLKEFIKAWNDSAPSQKVRVSKNENEATYHMLAFLYYSAFENALNTFMTQVLEDSMAEIKLCVDELHKLHAEITEKDSRK